MKNKHVYCTNCKHFEIIYKKNDFVPYCKYGEKGSCDVGDCEDSRPLYLRPMYKDKDKIICLVGPSGTGKTSIAYALKEKYGYNVIESYTARPPRYEGEKGHTFVDEFDEGWNPFPWLDGKAIPKNVVAYTKYNGYEYWIVKEQYKNKGISIYVVDIYGVKTLRENINDVGIVIIALHADKETLYRRLSGRDSKSRSQALDRMEYDQNAFAIIPCDYSVNANDSLEEVVERVNSIIQDHCRD